MQRYNPQDHPPLAFKYLENDHLASNIESALLQLINPRGKDRQIPVHDAEEGGQIVVLSRGRRTYEASNATTMFSIPSSESRSFSRMQIRAGLQEKLVIHPIIVNLGAQFYGLQVGRF